MNVIHLRTGVRSMLLPAIIVALMSPAVFAADPSQPANTGTTPFGTAPAATTNGTATNGTAASGGATNTTGANPTGGVRSPNYTIGPGDQLNVQVYGDQTLTQSATVLPDGTIAYPLIGRVAVAGQTPSQAASTLATHMGKYVKHPLVTVSVAQQGQYQVLVLGLVKTPGKYAVRTTAKLTDAIAAAGGLGPTNGDLPQARVTAPNGSISTVSLESLLHDGQEKLNVPLSDNAIVYVVGPNAFTVDVVGAVDRSGNITMNEGDRLSMAIARAGTSPNVYSDLNHVTVTRTDADGTTKSSQYNLYLALKEGDMRADPPLQKGDRVYVPMGKRPTNLNLDPLGLLGHFIGL